MLKTVLTEMLKTLSPIGDRAEVSLPPGGRFAQDEVFMGRVLQAEGDGRIWIATGENTFEAHTSLPLDEGTIYRFQVRATEPRVELKLLSWKDSAPDPSLKLWASGQGTRLKIGALLRDLVAASSLEQLNGPGKEALQHLDHLLPLLLYQGPEQDTALWLPQHLLASGIFWENKVLRHLLLDDEEKSLETMKTEDLKGLLLSIKEHLEARGDDSRASRSILKPLDQLLAMMKNHQLLNLNLIREGWGWYWFIGGDGGRDFLQGEVFGRKSEEEDAHHLHMNLSFSALGEVRVKCLLTANTITVTIRTSGEETARFLNANLPLLEKGLRQKGLRIGKMECVSSPVEPAFPPFVEGGTPASVVDVVT